MNNFHTSNKYYRLWVFWVGVIATIAYRIIVVFNNYSALLVDIAWYIGTIGFVWYFAHRFRVENYRERIIREMKLMDKIHNHKLSAGDYDALQYIVGSLVSSKAKWNYIILFVFSALALVYGIWVDFVA